MLSVKLLYHLKFNNITIKCTCQDLSIVKITCKMELVKYKSWMLYFIDFKIE